MMNGLIPLDVLAEKYGCDKLYSHSYIPKYIELLKGRRVYKLLEIGIGYYELMAPFVPKYIHGASLKMWQDYFPEARIFACDIREDTLINEERIASIICNQKSPLELLMMVALFGGNFDVIIDDGSHQFEHQLITAQTLMPYLAAGALYVVEDVKSMHMDILAKTIGGTYWPGAKRDDDNLVIIRK